MALSGQPSQREYVSKVDGDVEAHLIALSCSNPPDGHARWSLRLLADRAVELQWVEAISHETVRRVGNAQPVRALVPPLVFTHSLLLSKFLGR